MIKVTPQKEETLEKEGPEAPPERPLLDLSDAAVGASVTLELGVRQKGWPSPDGGCTPPTLNGQ